MTGKAADHGAQLDDSAPEVAGILVVTPNPAVDVTYSVAEQTIGSTVRVSGVRREPGGKGINVARVLRCLDIEGVTALQPLGGDTGRWIARELARQGIRTSEVEASHPTRTTVTVVDGIAHPTVFSEAGEPLGERGWAALAAQLEDQCTAGDVVVVSGSLPPGSPGDAIPRLVTAAHRAGARIVVDAGGTALLAAATAGADVVKPNETELLDATGAASLEAGIVDLLARGAGAVVVSRGVDGLIGALPGEDFVTTPGVPGVEGNPTGAGDAAAAAIALTLAARRPLSEALRLAAVLGAAAVLAPVAGVVDRAQLTELAGRLPAADRPDLSFSDPGVLLR